MKPAPPVTKTLISSRHLSRYLSITQPLDDLTGIHTIDDEYSLKRVSSMRTADRTAGVIRRHLLGTFLSIAAISLMAVSGTWAFGHVRQVGRAVNVPNGIWNIPDRDAVSFTVHAVAAQLLDLVGASPATSGVHWLKAAAHARSDTDDSKVVAGLVADRRRSTSTDELAAVLCSYEEHGAPHPRDDLLRAGFSCPW